MQRRKDDIKTYVTKLKHRFKRDSKPDVSGADYNWYLAQTAGMLPQSALKYFDPENGGYSEKTNKDKSPGNERANVSKYSNLFAFIALVGLFIAVQVWLSMTTELILSGPPDTPWYKIILRLTGSDQYGTIVTLNGIVVTAIALWLAVTESINSRLQTTIHDVLLSKKALLKKVDRYLKVDSTGLNRCLELAGFLKRPKVLRLQVRRVPDREQLRILDEDLKNINSRAAEFDLTIGILLGSVIALSASLTCVGTVAEALNYFQKKDDHKIGLIAIWVGFALVALHWFLFHVVSRDLMWTRDALKDAKWGGDRRRSMKYMVQFLYFQLEKPVVRKYTIIHRCFESIYFHAMGSVVLIFMVLLCFLPSPGLQGSAHKQWILAAIYISFGIVLPNVLIYFDVKGGLVFASAIDTGSVRWLRRFLMGRCYLMNIFVPVFCVLLAPHPSDYWWYLWWNPVFSACAFWLSRRILFELSSRRLAVSVSSFLSEIESCAAQQLIYRKV